jgi:Holliday junction resolvase RusA-like endonuclease
VSLHIITRGLQVTTESVENLPVPPIQIEQFNNSGRVVITTSLQPVSLQSSPARKDAFKEKLSEAIREHTDRIFLGDVQVDIEWYISQRDRYRSNRVADIDNIVKPILDSLHGPNGIMVDDGQVQAVDVRWMDPVRPALTLTIEVRALMSEDWFPPREGLYFVEFDNECMWPVVPSQLKEDPEAIALWVEAAYTSYTLSKYSEERRAAPNYADMLMPIQRFFNTTDLRRWDFEIRPVEDFGLTRESVMERFRP